MDKLTLNCGNGGKIERMNVSYPYMHVCMTGLDNVEMSGGGGIDGLFSIICSYGLTVLNPER